MIIFLAGLISGARGAMEEKTGIRTAEDIASIAVRSYPLNFYARCGEVVHCVFTISLVAALPRWDILRGILPLRDVRSSAS
jgi:hypothetical protein